MDGIVQWNMLKQQDIKNNSTVVLEKDLIIQKTVAWQHVKGCTAAANSVWLHTKRFTAVCNKHDTENLNTAQHTEQRDGRTHV